MRGRHTHTICRYPFAKIEFESSSGNFYLFIYHLIMYQHTSYALLTRHHHTP